MNRKTASTLVATLACFCTPLANAATLRVNVENVSAGDAPVEIHLFNSAEAWLEESIQKTVLTPESSTLTWDVSDLPDGEYGVYVYQDLNKNGKMDRNFMGMPTEPYAFSNDAKGKFGPAKWNAAKFAVEGEAAVTIKL